MTEPLRTLALASLAIAVLGAGASLNGGHLQAQQACQNFELTSILVNVRRDPARPGGYLDVLEKGDVACVTEERKIEDVSWAFIAKKTTEAGAISDVGGWANMRYLTPSDKPEGQQTAAAPGAEAPTREPDKAAASASSPSSAGTADSRPKGEPAPAAATTPAKPQTPAPRQSASAAPALPPSDTLKFDQPVPFGAYPVQGHTLEELADGEPLFAPIEGLPEELWKKPCATCHKWNKERLCTQGSSYLKAAKYVLRHQHPYGGPYKLALMRWAKSGCE